MTDLLGRLAYHRWATVRVLSAAEVLAKEDFARDLRSSHGGVRGTLTHLLGEAVSPFAPPPFPDVPSVAALRGPWLELLDAYPHDLVRYRNRRASRKAPSPRSCGTSSTTAPVIVSSPSWAGRGDAAPA